MRRLEASNASFLAKSQGNVRSKARTLSQCRFLTKTLTLRNIDRFIQLLKKLDKSEIWKQPGQNDHRECSQGSSLVG